MENDGRIYIVITDKRPGNGPSTPGDVVNQDTDTDSNFDPLANYAFHQFYHFMEGQIKKAINYQISNMGNFKGNYQSQRDIQSTLSDLGALGGIAGATLAGAKAGAMTGSPIGAVLGAAIGFTVSTVSLGVNAVYEENSLRAQAFQNNIAINQLRMRAGLNQLTNGSRGTLN